MSKWKNLKNGGEIYEGDDASDFPEAPLGDEIGRYESDNEFIITHIANDEYYTYITHRFPGGGGDTGIVMRFEKYGVEDNEITIGDTNWIDITKVEAL